MRRRLVSERKARKWTQQYVAEQLGITLRAYQYYERGDREPPLAAAYKLEDLFDVNNRELLVRDSTTDSESA